MTSDALPSWQTAAHAGIEHDPGPDAARTSWPHACLIIGFISAVLWSLIWTAVLSLFG